MVQAQKSRLPKVLEHLPDPTTPASRGDSDRTSNIAAVESAIGYAFANPALLRAALTVASWVNEHQDAGWPTNACLEFFGDAVLDLLAADELWRRFPELNEGPLTRLRASIVAEPALAKIAERLGLGGALYLGKGEAKQGKRNHPPTLADALEAVLGAVYLDARERGDDPMDRVAEVFGRVFAELLDDLHPDEALDPKSRLQHWIQAEHRITPTYVRVGPPPSTPGEPWMVRVEVHHPEQGVTVLGEAVGRSLKEAERAAAIAALKQRPAV